MDVSGYTRKTNLPSDLIWIGILLWMAEILGSGLLGRGTPGSVEISDPGKAVRETEKRDSRKNYLPGSNFMV